MRKGTIALLLGLTLLIPAAMAAGGSGSFSTIGEMTFTSETKSTFQPLALFDGCTGDLKNLQLSAASLRVHVFERKDYIVDPMLLPPFTVQPPGIDQRTWTVEEANVSLIAGNHTGLLGLYANGGMLEFVSKNGPLVESRPPGVFPDDELGEDDTQSLPLYRRNLGVPYLHLEGEGTISYGGPGGMKLIGPDVVIESHNTSTIRTGVVRLSPIELQETWVVLEWTSGGLHLESEPGCSIEAAAPLVDIKWGAVKFRPVSGSLDTEEAHYRVAQAASPVTIRGDLTGSIQPIHGGRGASFDFKGDVQDVSLAGQPVSTGPRLGGLPEWVGLAVVGLALAGTLAIGGVSLRRRAARRGPAPATPVQAQASMPARSLVAPVAPLSYGFGVMDRAAAEAHAERAFEAAGKGDWLVAAGLFKAARRFDPSMPGLALNEGISLFKAGYFQMALSALDDAAPLADDGEAEMWAAEAALSMGNEREAAHHLLGALERQTSAKVLSQIAGEAVFACLRERPEVAAALEQALMRNPPDSGQL